MSHRKLFICWIICSRGKRKRTALGAEVAEKSSTAQKDVAKKSVNRKGLFYHCNCCTMSMSDELSSNTSTLSPDYFLHRPKLSTILSRKEAREIGNPKQKYSEEEPHNKVERKRRRKKKSESKSLTDLQFEELKRFMDLGFVFSEEDKDSNLVSIIDKFRADEMAKANEFIRKQRQRDWEAFRLSLIEVEKKYGD